MNSKCHIVYDIDDVLAEFWGTVLPAMNNYYRKNVKKEHFTDYTKVGEAFGIDQTEFLRFIVDYGLLNLMQPTQMKHSINNDYAKGNHITVISSRDYHPEALDITDYWLRQNGINYDDLHISGKTKKSEFVDLVDIVYDDHSKNIDDFFDSGVMSKDGVGFIIDQPWNKNYTRQNVKRITNYA